MRKIPFISGEYYHVYNRGVDKRIIYLDDRDYFRFLKEMRFMNSLNSVTNIYKKEHSCETESRNFRKEDEKLVDIVAYCLMPNHFHLILRQVVDGGISKFMQKVAIGYTQFFNLKYARTGVLFQGAFKAKPTIENAYLLHLLRYIHQNPAELFGGSDADLKSRLSLYKWSSLPFYLDETKRCIIKLSKDIILKQFNDMVSFNSFIFDSDPSRLEGFSLLSLE